jgi:hypothetical protein
MPYVSWENFEDLLCTRRDNVREWWSWEIPDCIWDYAMELLEESDGLADPELNTPSYIVDNIAVNGSWSEFSELENSDHYPEYAGLSGDDLAEAIEDRGDAIAVFRDEKIVLWNLGL